MDASIAISTAPATGPQPRAQISDNLRMLAATLHDSLDQLLTSLNCAESEAPQAQQAALAAARLSELTHVLTLAGADAAARLMAMAHRHLLLAAEQHPLVWPPADSAAVVQALWSMHDYLDALHDKDGSSDICDWPLFTASRRLQSAHADAADIKVAVPVNEDERSTAFAHALGELEADRGFDVTLAAVRTMEAALSGMPELAPARAFIGRIAAGVQPLDTHALSVLASLAALLAAMRSDPSSIVLRTAFALRRIAFLQAMADEEASRKQRPGEEPQQMLKLMFLADELLGAWDHCVGIGGGAGRVGAAWQWCEIVLRAFAVSRRIWPRLRVPGVSGFLAALSRLALDLAMSPRTDGRDREVSSCLIFFDEGLRRRIHNEEDFIGQVDCIVDHLAMLARGETEPEPFPWFSRELRSDMARRMQGVVERKIQGKLAGIEQALETLWSPDYPQAVPVAGDDPEESDAASGATPAALMADINTDFAKIEGLAAQLRSVEIRELARTLRIQAVARLPDTLRVPDGDLQAQRRGDALRAVMVRDIALLGQLIAQACRSPFNHWDQRQDEKMVAPADPALVADIRRVLDQEGGEPVPSDPTAPASGHFAQDALGEWQPQERDQEMIEIFLIEARQMLDSLREDLPRLAGASADVELLASVRRCFHTFKGSGRMVGLVALSDAAHAVEILLNACLAEARATGCVALAQPVLTLLENSRLLLEEWIGDLATQGGSCRTAPSLVAAALVLRKNVAATEPEAHENKIVPATLQLQVDTVAAAPPVFVPAVARPEEPSSDAANADPQLRDIYLNEARQLFKTLRQHGSSWRAKANSGLIVPAPPLFMRAIHTLRGCSAAAGFAGMQQLAGLLDDLLEQIKAAAAGLNGNQLATVERAVDAMNAMQDQYRQGTLPAAPVPESEALSALLQHFRQPHASANAAGVPGPMPDVAATSYAIGNEAGELRDEIDHDLLPVFLEEGQDLLAAVGEGLHRFQRDSSDSAAISELQRPLHTVKGSARMAGALRLGHLMHELESGVQRMLRKEEGPDAVAGLLALYDQALKQFEALEQLSALGAGDGVSAPLQRLSESERKLASPLVRIKVSALDKLLNQVGEVSIARSQLENEVEALHKSAQELAENIAKLSAQLRDVEIQAEIQMAASHQASGESMHFDPLELDRFTYLQELTRMMAENVNDAASLQKQLIDSAGKTQEGLRRQGRLTRELQQELMYTRMVKFKSLEQRLHHLVRQLGNETGKALALEIGGGDVELDRGILERMIGPFEHLLRNAAVHGIEAGAERAAAGKQAAGRLSVQAAQEGSEAIIRIADDGSGLDLAAIRSKGAAQGLISEDAALGDARVSELIFEPGFTTASEVSTLAGRGVGMDVVRSEVTALGGRVTVESQAGAGVHFTIHLPLSLAVKQVCLLRQGEQTYAIPSMLIDKVVQLRGKEMRQALDEEALPEGGRMVVLHPLDRLLDEPRADSSLLQLSSYVLFVKGGNELVAILVDQVLGNREVVAKPLGPQLDTLVGVVGATVLGNGEIALIINPLLLARRTGIRRLASRPAEIAPRVEQKMVMVVDDSLTVRKVMQRLLAREGYAVATATDGYDAIRQLHDLTPDIFLVDIEMPRMDGYTLVRHLRDNESTRSKPIIMITSRTGAKHRERAMEVGVNHYMGKPYQDEQLLELIRHFTSDAGGRAEDDFSDVLY